MKALKITLLVINRESSATEDLIEDIERARHACPITISVDEAEIGVWTDDHPLNKSDTMEAELERLFPSAERDKLRAALIRLRDCDWTIGRGDRMDPVRDIAREALETMEEKL